MGLAIVYHEWDMRSFTTFEQNIVNNQCFHTRLPQNGRRGPELVEGRNSSDTIHIAMLY